MKVYVLRNIQHDIYGIYKNEKIADHVKNNLNKQIKDQSPFYYIEAYELRDDSYA